MQSPIANIYEMEGYQHKRLVESAVINFAPYSDALDIVDDELTVHNLLKRLEEDSSLQVSPPWAGAPWPSAGRDGGPGGPELPPRSGSACSARTRFATRPSAPVQAPAGRPVPGGRRRILTQVDGRLPPRRASASLASAFALASSLASDSTASMSAFAGQSSPRPVARAGSRRRRPSRTWVRLTTMSGPRCRRRTPARSPPRCGRSPSPEEVERFVNDRSPDAWPKLVDRLLDSPGYAEQWARHWLDVVRFAESDGFEYDTHRSEAWRYRDYVIRSIREDKPYDQFLREQLAGDEIDPKNEEMLVAAGFHRLGSAAQECRQSGRGIQPQRDPGGDDERDRLGAARRDARLRTLPRSQVRSHPAEGLLPDAGVLQPAART